MNQMMVDSVDVLTMHLIWKFSGMSAQVATADVAAKEKMCSQRDQLLERLVEYTSGGHSNVCEAVKKTASILAYNQFKDADDWHRLSNTLSACTLCSALSRVMTPMNRRCRVTSSSVKCQMRLNIDLLALFNPNWSSMRMSCPSTGSLLVDIHPQHCPRMKTSRRPKRARRSGESNSGKTVCPKNL
jgi:hypothetical protein